MLHPGIHHTRRNPTVSRVCPILGWVRRAQTGRLRTRSGEHIRVTGRRGVTRLVRVMPEKNRLAQHMAQQPGREGGPEQRDCGAALPVRAIIRECQRVVRPLADAQ